MYYNPRKHISVIEIVTCDHYMVLGMENKSSQSIWEACSLEDYDIRKNWETEIEEWGLEVGLLDRQQPEKHKTKNVVEELNEQEELSPSQPRAYSSFQQPHFVAGYKEKQFNEWCHLRWKSIVRHEIQCLHQFERII